MFREIRDGKYDSALAMAEEPMTLRSAVSRRVPGANDELSSDGSEMDDMSADGDGDGMVEVTGHGVSGYAWGPRKVSDTSLSC